MNTQDLITPQLKETLQALNVRESEYMKILGILGREPNFTELCMFSALWSEHCCYKHSRHLLKKLPVTGPRIVQGPGENAGIVDAGDGIHVAFKVESHNHPTAVEPYQGAATGVGGILRDIITMNARPVALLNALRFGPMEDPSAPSSRKSTVNRYRLTGAVKGIGDYGNCMGVPTIGGDIFFHACYSGNPLVNAMAVGIMEPEGIMSAKAAGVGNPVLYVGSPTGRDGMGGAAFASRSLDETKKAEDRPAVQVGDPFAEKLLLESCLEAFKTGLVVAAQDMGAAGLTCATAEMSAKGGIGMRVDLDKVPCREPGMQPWEYLNSESQERMLMVLEKGKEQPVLDVFVKWGVPAAIIGEVIGEDRVLIDWHGERVVDLPATALTDRTPSYAPSSRPEEPQAMVQRRECCAEDGTPSPTLAEIPQWLEKMMRRHNIARPSGIFRQYDRHVRNNTMLASENNAAGVIRLRKHDGQFSGKALAVTLNGNSRYVELEPYVGAMTTIAECVRNLVAVGAEPLAVTDNLNYGDPEDETVYYQLYYSVEGLRDACLAFNTPVTGGNVSLYNTTDTGSAILPSPVIGMVGLIADETKVMTPQFKRVGDRVAVLGRFRPSLGGSEFQAMTMGESFGPPPSLSLNEETALVKVVLQLIAEGLVQSVQDVSLGGLLTTLAECCFSAEPLYPPCGLSLALDPLAAQLRESGITTSLATLLFGETNGSFVLSYPEAHEARIQTVLADAGRPALTLIPLGHTMEAPELTLMLEGQTASADMKPFDSAWREGLML
jgi:phosphoribosylformylglycinamidine synthase